MNSYSNCRFLEDWKDRWLLAYMERSDFVHQDDGADFFRLVFDVVFDKKVSDQVQCTNSDQKQGESDECLRKMTFDRLTELHSELISVDVSLEDWYRFNPEYRVDLKFVGLRNLLRPDVLMEGRWWKISFCPSARPNPPKLQGLWNGSNLLRYSAEGVETLLRSCTVGFESFDWEVSRREMLPDDRCEIGLDGASMFDGLSSVGSGHRVVDVMNVGQGNWNVVRDGSDEPLLYFDLGAAFGPNEHTRPSCLKGPTLKDGVPVILSHWDMDHWILGREIVGAMDRVWLTPSQSFGPTTARFVDQLRRHKGGRLKFVKKGSSGLVPGIGRLCSADGKCKNDSGLVLFVESKNGQKVVLPGDASYECIPALNNSRYAGVVVPHHGSFHCRERVPYPVGGGSVAALSYGFGNSYRHPAAQVVCSHQNRGWRVASTANTPAITKVVITV